MSFEQQLLQAIGYPAKESAHQALLAAHLASDPKRVGDLLGAATPLVGTLPGVAELGGQASVHREVHFDARSRVDLVCRFDDVVIAIECKVGAQTDADQLMRYAVAMEGDAARYPNPCLLLVSVDGACPRMPHRFAERLSRVAPSVKVASVSWSALQPGESTAMEKVWRLEHGGLIQGFKRAAERLMGGEAVGPEDFGPESLRPLAGRFALTAFGEEVLRRLNCRTDGRTWRMITPAHPGPRGDIQFDIAPADDRWWSAYAGELAAPDSELGTHLETQGEYGDRGLRQSQFVRLYIDQNGLFRLVVGAQLEPYPMFVPVGRLRRAFDAALGNFEDQRRQHHNRLRDQAARWRDRAGGRAAGGENLTAYRAYWIARGGAGQDVWRDRDGQVVRSRIDEAVRLIELTEGA